MLRAVVVGMGRRGREHIALLQEIADLGVAGLVAASAQACQEAERDLKLPTYTTLEEALAATRPDYVVLATPVRGRSALVEQAAAFSSVRAILVEKPFAFTRADGERMLAACARRNVLLMIGHQWRFTSDLAAMKAALEASVIGRVELFRGVSYGNFLDQGVHLLDAIRWLSGDQRVLWAMSQACNDPHQLARWEPWKRGYWRDEGHPVPMWMTHHLALAGGARVSLETGLLCPRSKAGVDAWHERRIIAVGTEGIAECRPGHGFWTHSKNGTHRHEAAAGSLTEAARRMHEAVYDTLLNRRPYPFAASDALLTLEGLSLCAASAACGDLASPPLEAERDYFAALSQRDQQPATSQCPLAAEAMRFSVLIPLPVHRGQAIPCVQSWISGQQFSRDRFEVFVLADGSEPDLEERVRAMLGPGDHFVHEEGANRCRLYDLAARQARGQFLVFTESHCVAEAEFLRELDRYFATTAVDGACCRTIAVSDNNFARMDELLHEEGFRQFRQEGDWRKINVHAFALRCSAYLDAGGMDPRYDLFAEMILAAALRDGGSRLGYAAAPAVRHFFRTTVREVLPDVEIYVNGESKYRQDHPGPDCIGHTFLQASWERGHEAELAAALRHILRKDARRRLLRGDVSGLKAVWNTWRQSLQGGRWERFTAWCALQWTLARCQFWRWHPRRLETAYRDAWNAMGRLSRLRFLAQNPSDPPPATEPRLRFAITDLAEHNLLGFHAVETWQNRPFRWTGRAALLHLSLPPATYDVCIDTGNVRQDSTPLNLRVYVNNHPIQTAYTENGWFRLRIHAHQLREDGSQDLVLTCRPVKPWKKGVADYRELGLPIFSMQFMPVASASRQAA